MSAGLPVLAPAEVRWVTWRMSLCRPQAPALAPSRLPCPSGRVDDTDGLQSGARRGKRRAGEPGMSGGFSARLAYGGPWSGSLGQSVAGPEALREPAGTAPMAEGCRRPAGSDSPAQCNRVSALPTSGGLRGPVPP